MRLLVTGGAGFIGSNFTHYWTARHPDDHIVVLDKLTYAGNPLNLAGIPEERLLFSIGDISDPKKVAKAIEGVNLVVHFAAETHVDNSIGSGTEFALSNVVGTISLLEAARRNGTRVHHISTDEVYGVAALGTTFKESTPYAPRNPYSATKAGSDHLVRAYHLTHGLPITISNCGNNYGPRQHDEKLIPTIIRKTLAGERVPVYGDGMQRREWIYVDDHCAAVERIIEDGVIGETYLVGGEEMTNIDVVRAVHDAMGLSRKKSDAAIEHVKDRPGHDVRYAIDDGKLRSRLGWERQVPFAKGIKKTVDWYLARQ